MATTTANRTKVNGQQYAAPEFQKSGFNLSHNRYSSYILGKIHVTGLQWIMPGDKVSGQNNTNLTAHTLVTPMVTPIDVSQYNFFLPLRALDTSFIDGMSPTKENGMSASWHTPTTTLKTLVDYYVTNLRDEWDDISGDTQEFTLSNLLEFLVAYDATSSGYTPSTYTINNWITAVQQGETDFQNLVLADVKAIVTQIIEAYTGNTMSQLYADFDNHYLLDGMRDAVDYLKSFGFDNITGTDLVADFAYNLFTALFTPFFGRYSYLAELRLPYLRPSDLYNLSHWVDINPARGFSNNLSTVEFNEYPLRFMYALWYERFRDVNLEPVSANLPKWRQFSNTSVITPVYCFYRFRSWYNDMFVSAQPDDMSRHVFAPIYAVADSDITYHGRAVNNEDAEGLPAHSDNPLNNINSVNLTWRDSLTGQQRSLFCPVPANINDAISRGDESSADVYGLQLSALRQAKMLERYLKRNYLFGDEYQDRMLAHYNTRVSDMRINRPELLSSSLDSVNFSQEVANMTNEITKAGTRVATATAAAKSDSYSFFAEEFGLLVNVLTIMPRAQYDGLLQQSLLKSQIDFPLPEFAANNEEFGRCLEIADSGLYVSSNNDAPHTGQFIFGHFPAYHAWRERVDEVGGEYLNELQDATFRRFFGMLTEDTTPKLNYEFIHCSQVNLSMFENTVKYDAQFYGDTVHDCYVERVLPTPVEVI